MVIYRDYNPERPPSLLLPSRSPLKKNARSAARHNPVLFTLLYHEWVLSKRYKIASI